MVDWNIEFFIGVAAVTVEHAPQDTETTLGTISDHEDKSSCGKITTSEIPQR